MIKPFNKFAHFVLDVGKGLHNLHSTGDALKVYLTNATPDPDLDLIKEDLAEIDIGNGYLGGADPSQDIQNDYSEVDGDGVMTAEDVVITASGGPVGPFRYAVIYNDSCDDPVDPLVGWIDYGSSVTLLDKEKFTIELNEWTLIFTENPPTTVGARFDQMDNAMLMPVVFNMGRDLRWRIY